MNNNSNGFGRIDRRPAAHSRGAGRDRRRARRQRRWPCVGRRHAVASGVVWRDGLVVTAAHVFRRTPAAATLVGADGRAVEATLVGIDSPTDSRCFAWSASTALPALAIGDAAIVRAGHVAIAVGRSGDGDTLASAGLVNRRRARGRPGSAAPSTG